MSRSRPHRVYPGIAALTIVGLGTSVAIDVPGVLGGGGVASAASKSKPSKTTKSKPKPTMTKTTVAGTKSAATPNILFVLADDLGVDASPCYPSFGSVKPKMPNVERLCQEGVVFDNTTASPVCSPSRAAALTGKYGFRTSVGTVDDVLGAEETTVLDLVATAPTPYANAVIGKWHLGARGDATHPQKLGAQYFDGFLSGTVQDYSSWQRVTQGQMTASSTYTTTAFTDSAIAWTSKQTKPWLLWLAYNAPHAPFHLPPANLLSKPTPNGAPADIRENPRQYYMASLEALDNELGRLLRSLPPATRNNTVVMFMGDNGTPGRVIQAPFAAETSKGTVAEGGVHMPLIVAGAGVTDKGKRSAALVNGVDVHATIAALTGAKTAGPIDGVSFAAQLTDAAAPGSRSYAYTELFGEQETGTATGTATTTLATPRRRAGAGGNATEVNVWAVRDVRYKLVHDVSAGTDQLFDLQMDPSEVSPLPTDGTNVEIVTRLRAFVTQLRR
jgi:arylsulfatase B